MDTARTSSDRAISTSHYSQRYCLCDVFQSNSVSSIEFKDNFLRLNLTVILQRRVSCDFNEMIPNNVQAAYEEITRIIVANIYVTLATSSLSGQPHISPVCFSFDNSLRLFWASSTGEHLN